MFGFTILLLFNLQCCWQVLQTSTDPEQQFTAPFKAGNSRQVQTCYKPTVQRQRKLQHFLVYSGMGETEVLTTLNHCASTQRRSLFCVHKHFHLVMHKLLRFVLTEWNNAVITHIQITLLFVWRAPIWMCLHCSSVVVKMSSCIVKATNAKTLFPWLLP